MISDEFIKSIITPESKREKATMNREFHGLMEVQHNEQTNSDEEGGDE